MLTSDGDLISDGDEVARGTDPLTTTPTTPTGLRATVGDNSIYLKWDAIIGDVDGFSLRIEAITANGIVQVGLITIPGHSESDLPVTATILTDQTAVAIQNDVTYKLTLRASYNGIFGLPSKSILAITGQFTGAPLRPTRPLLFLHGFNSSGDTWGNTTSFLQRGLHWSAGGRLRHQGSSLGATADDDF